MITDYLYKLATDRVGGVFATVVKALLWVLSLAYGLVVVVLAALQLCKPETLKCRVISVGNITWGGTGKTPLVAFLAGFLQSERHKVAILTRGYKKGLSSMGDEPAMLAESLSGVSIVVNSDRIKGGKEAISRYGADTLILDDALQQWRVKKDLEIVTIDASNPFGNGCLIPRGILREPLSALTRADVFVVTNADMSDNIGQLKALLSARNPTALIVTARHKSVGFFALGNSSQLFGVERLRTKPVALVSGIGNPESFRSAVEALQIPVAHSFVFPDHHAYAAADLQMIVQGARGRNIGTIITTQKDAGKLGAIAALDPSLNFVIMRVSIEIIDHEEQFYSRLRSLYSA
jgi:tetraacyldisaccharide 4'-kinase